MDAARSSKPNRLVLEQEPHTQSLKRGPALPLVASHWLSEFIHLFSLAAKSAQWPLLPSWSLLIGGRCTWDHVAQSEADGPAMLYRRPSDALQTEL